MEKGINTEKDFEIAKKIAHVLSGDCSEENRSSLDEWLSESEGNRNLYERILDERNREAFQKNAAKFDRSVGWEKLLQAASENNRQADTNASPCFALGCSSDLGLRSWCGCNVILGAENRSREHGGTK